LENQEIIEFFKTFSQDKNYFDIPDSLFVKMNEEHGILLRDEITYPQLFKLPSWEIKFFDWLKEEEPLVWNDLWTVDDADIEPYLVSLAFLPLILKKDGRGFPICDLTEVDNYYFLPFHIESEEGKILVESVKQLFVERRELTHAQLLALEISFGPIDIWHFAYKHKIQLNAAKEAVSSIH